MNLWSMAKNGYTKHADGTYRREVEIMVTANDARRYTMIRDANGRLMKSKPTKNIVD